PTNASLGREQAAKCITRVSTMIRSICSTLERPLIIPGFTYYSRQTLVIFSLITQRRKLIHNVRTLEYDVQLSGSHWASRDPTYVCRRLTIASSLARGTL